VKQDSAKVDEESCKAFNADLMRALVAKKLNKHKTFYELKVLEANAPPNTRNNHPNHKIIPHQTSHVNPLFPNTARFLSSTTNYIRINHNSHTVLKKPLLT
jgi:hypothetical protein